MRKRSRPNLVARSGLRSDSLALRSGISAGESPTGRFDRTEKAHGFLEDLRPLDITVDEESTAYIFGDVHRLAVDYGLSGYDASYLELAIRKGLPLATLDDQLMRAASASGVELFSEPARDR